MSNNNITNSESFDEKNYIGLKIDDVKKMRLNYRIDGQDGLYYMPPMDYNPSRYNFIIKDGIITHQSKG